MKKRKLNFIQNTYVIFFLSIFFVYLVKQKRNTTVFIIVNKLISDCDALGNLTYIPKNNSFCSNFVSHFLFTVFSKEIKKDKEAL